MEHFYKPDVFRELGDRKKRIEYLKGHYRHPTANSWNNSTSYANEVKIYNLPVDKDKAFEAIETCAFWVDIDTILYEFGRSYKHEYQAAFNGRSGGHIVLLKGGQERDGSGDLTRIFTSPGQDIDMGETFEEWDEYELGERVKLIISFDKMCDNMLELLHIHCREM